MKIKLIIITYLMTGLIGSVIGQDTLKLSSPNGFAQLVFTAFKTNDYSLFESLLITRTKYDLMLDKIDATDNEKEEYRKRGLGALSYLHNQAKDNFNNILDNAMENEINWNTVNIIEIIPGYRESQGIEQADIMILAKSGEQKFSIILNNCHKVDNWYIMDELKFIIPD